MSGFSEIIKDIESELYSLVNSISNLNDKYRKGAVNEFFFRKAIKNAMSNLLNINFTIKKNNMMLSTILDNMHFTEQYYNSIDIINTLSSLTFTKTPEDHAKFEISEVRNRNAILTLPGITAKITSSFITLLDALKLEGLQNHEFILKLFDELYNEIIKFPDSSKLEKKINQISKHCKNNPRSLIHNAKYREKVGDHLYGVYKEFQMKLNL